MIKTSNLSYTFDEGERQMVFPDIDLPQGEQALMLGPSGSGKTTLLHLLCGFYRPTTGEIKIDNVTLNPLSTQEMDKFRGAHMGVVFQRPTFWPGLKVMDQLKFAGYLAHQDWASIGKQRALNLLEKLGLAAYSNKSPDDLSVGERQRLGIALAIIHEPKVILADEPTSALDDHNALSVNEILCELSVATKATLVIVTHDVRLKNEYPHQIILS